MVSGFQGSTISRRHECTSSVWNKSVGRREIVAKTEHHAPWTTALGSTASTQSSTATTRRPRRGPQQPQQFKKQRQQQQQQLAPTQYFSLLPQNSLKQSIPQARVMEQNLLSSKSDLAGMKRARKQQWTNSWLSLITKWARIGHGHQAERCRTLGWEQLQNNDLSVELQIKAHRRVLYAWCNQIKRQVQKHDKMHATSELAQFAQEAQETLQAMEELVSEQQEADVAKGKTTCLLNRHDYMTVLLAHAKAGQAQGALQVLRKLEFAYQQHEFHPDWAPTLSAYTSVIKSLANVASGRAQDATNVAQSCLIFYQKTKRHKPDVMLYNAVLDAWSKELPILKKQDNVQVTRAQEVAEGAQHVFQRMRDAKLKPNTQSYALLLYTYCKCDMLDKAYSVWQQLMDRLLSTSNESLKKKKEPVDTRSFTMLVNSLARRIHKDNDDKNAVECAQRIGHILDGMWRLHHEGGYTNVAPNKYMYTTAISSWATVKGSPESLQRAQDWFMDLEFKYQSTGWDSLCPDVAVYNGLVHAYAKQQQQQQLGDTTTTRTNSFAAAADKAESLVKKMQSLGRINANVRPDTITYNTLMDVYLAASDKDNNSRYIQRAQETLQNMMDEYENKGNNRVKPNPRSFACLIRALATREGSAAQAEKLLMTMGQYFDPQASLYKDVILAWCRDAQTRSSNDDDDAEESVRQAQGLLYRMEALNKDTELPSMRPDMELYNAVIDAWIGLGQDGVEQVERVRERRDRQYENTNDELVQKKTFDSPADVFALLRDLEETDNGSKIRPVAKTENFNALLSILAKSEKVWAAQRAQDVLEYMLESYQSSGDAAVKPDVISFNNVIAAWARCSDQESASKAEALLDRLNNLQENGMLPDVFADRITYNTVINAHAKSTEPFSAQEAERVFQRLSTLYESTLDEAYRPNIVSYTSLINGWANSDDALGAKQAEEILLRMLQDHKADPTSVKPNTMCFNAVLHAWATRTDGEGAQKAEMMLNLMEDMYIGGNDDVQPETQTYNIVLNALANSRDEDAGSKARQLLQRMHEEHRNGNTAVKPDLITYNTVINAVANTGGKEALEGIGTLLEEVYDSDDLDLDVEFFSSLITALSRTDAKGAVWLAEQIIAVLNQMNKNGVTPVKPDTSVYNALLHCWAKSGERTASRRAEDILNYMEAEFQRGNEQMKPNIATYTSVIDVFAKSRSPDVDKAEELFRRMQRRYDAGDYDLRPNAHAYTALIQTYARSDHPDKAMRSQSVLKRMKADYAGGNKGAQPTVVAYNAVLNACEHAWFGDDEDVQESFKVACTTFDEMRSSSPSSVRPDHVTYGTFLGVCGVLMPNSDVRNDMLELVFRRSCAEGQVGPVVLKKLREAASPSMYYRLLDGAMSENELPTKWSVNVKER